MTLVRFQQVVSAIMIDRAERDRKQEFLTSWSTRTLAGFAITAAQVDEKGMKQLSEAVESVVYSPIEAALRGMGGSNEGGEKENRRGSYEALLGLFGGSDPQPIVDDEDGSEVFDG